MSGHSQRVWRHNRLFGCCGMIRQNAAAVLEADTTTTEAKALAEQIQDLATKLGQALKTRLDSPKKEGT